MTAVAAGDRGGAGQRHEKPNSDLPHGELLQVDEVVQAGGEEMHGRSVRVLGM